MLKVLSKACNTEMVAINSKKEKEIHLQFQRHANLSVLSYLKNDEDVPENVFTTWNRLVGSDRGMQLYDQTWNVRQATCAK